MRGRSGGGEGRACLLAALESIREGVVGVVEAGACKMSYPYAAAALLLLLNCQCCCKLLSINHLLAYSMPAHLTKPRVSLLPPLALYVHYLRHLSGLLPLALSGL